MHNFTSEKVKNFYCQQAPLSEETTGMAYDNHMNAALICITSINFLVEEVVLAAIYHPVLITNIIHN